MALCWLRLQCMRMITCTCRTCSIGNQVHWIVPSNILQSVKYSLCWLRWQCMRRMLAWHCVIGVYGIVLITLVVYEDDACMRRWLANRWNWRRRSGRGYLCPPGHALSYNPHLPQPAAGAKCILYFLVCISFLMQTIPIQNNCLSNCSSQPSMVHWLSSSIFPCCCRRRRPAMVTSVQISLLVAPHPQTHTFSESLW